MSTAMMDATLRHLDRRRANAPRARGVAAVLAMMFLVIFGSLAAAMAIVSQGNLQTAQSHLKINRTLAAAETGLSMMTYHLEAASRFDGDGDRRPDITTTAGIITSGDASNPDGDAYLLWEQVRGIMLARFQGNDHNLEEPALFNAGIDPIHGQIVGLRVGPIRVGPGEPDFIAEFTPHPLPDEDYDALLYDRLPYGRPTGLPGSDEYIRDMQIKEAAGIDFIVGDAVGYDATYDLDVKPLDGRFLRVRVVSFDDGATGANSYQGAEVASQHARVYRSVQMDYLITKRIPYALLSRSRIMVGRNVQIDGPIGSHFREVNLQNGHPVQSVSDFRGLDSNLDDDLDALIGTLISNDVNGDNRININSSSETDGIVDPEDFDRDGDGYISDFDFVLKAFDSNDDGRISRGEFGTTSDTTKEQLFDLINEVSPWAGIGDHDDFLDGSDFYAKIRGQVSILATESDWEGGAAGGAYQDFLQGPLMPDYGQAPVTFDDTSDADAFQFTQDDFNIARFADAAATTVEDQAAAPIANDPTAPTEFVPPSDATRESVPFNAAFPYDYYERPVYRNMVFENARIAKGTNALFENCRFIGVTYIETEPQNEDPLFNYVGMQNADGSFKHPDKTIEIGGVEYGGNAPDVGEAQALGTKALGNNVRFHNCTFEGAIVSGQWSGGTTSLQPAEYTHVRNKIAFTGNTNFNVDGSTELSDEEKDLYRRSTLVLPHFSVEMGSFDEAYSNSETVELSGTVVAGLIDMRGQVNVNGTVVTTFEPLSDTGPVIGNTSPQFNTTLGYFDGSAGDLEANLPSVGLGKISLRYDPTIPLPDGIDGPITIEPIRSTFVEGGR
ncbi:MAG: EF-hand domain-containing protein [Planctomycetota bacterium]